MSRFGPTLPAIAILLAAGGAAAESQSINLFAIPSQAIVDEVAKISDELKAEGIQTFYGKGLPVHATLYLTDYPPSALPDIEAAAQDIALRWRPFQLGVQNVEVTAGNWVFLGINLNAELQRLADEAVMKLAPLRDPGTPMPGWVRNYPEKVAAFERYGSPNVFQNFQPHLTLLAEEQSPQLATFAERAKGDTYHAQGEIVGIGVGIADEWGQIESVIAEYQFSTD